jgi:hypothetical protein
MNLLDMNLKAVFVKYIAIGSYNNKNNKLLECISNKLQAGVAKLQPGFVHVTRICSRTRDWPACVAPAKNNFICVFIVNRDKLTRDAGRCAGRYPTAKHPHA